MKPGPKRDALVLDLRPHGYDPDIYTLEATKLRRGKKKYPGGDMAMPFDHLSAEYEIVTLSRESATETYGKMGTLLLLAAFFGYYALEVGWALFVVAGLCALPAVFMLRGRLKPLRKRMNFLVREHDHGFSIAYFADEEAKVLAFAEELKRRLPGPVATRHAGPEAAAVARPEQDVATPGWSGPARLEVRKRRGLSAQFVLEESEVVISPESGRDAERRIPYWRISPEYLRNPDSGRQVGRRLLWLLLWLPLSVAFGWGARAGVWALWIPAALAALGAGSSIHELLRERSSQYLFFEDLDGEVMVRIPYDQSEEPRVLEFINLFEDRLKAFSARRREENGRIEDGDDQED